MYIAVFISSFSCRRMNEPLCIYPSKKKKKIESHFTANKFK